MRVGVMKWGISLLVLLGAASASWAEAVQKIGFVDTERVYRESNDAQVINEKLQQEFSKQFAQLAQLEKQGLALQKQLLSNKLNAVEKKSQQERMAQLNKQYLDLKISTDEEYKLRRNEEFASMQLKANQALVALAKSEKYDVIVQDVVYVRSEFDITDKLIQQLNRH